MNMLGQYVDCTVDEEDEVKKTINDELNDANLLVFIVSYMCLMILTYLCLINLIKLHVLIHKSISAILSKAVNAL